MIRSVADIVNELSKNVQRPAFAEDIEKRKSVPEKCVFHIISFREEGKPGCVYFEFREKDFEQLIQLVASLLDEKKKFLLFHGNLLLNKG